MRGSATFRTGVAPGGALAPRWSKDRLWRAARAVPSLDLNFADSKSLTDGVTGQNLVTFTRASSGTFVGSDGVLRTAANDVPRFDHNPLTGESLGLLVEEQRTNLWTYSGDFANAAWIKVRSSITSNTIVAPDGTLTGDKLIASTDASTTHFVRQDVSVTSGTAYTQTIYAKAGEYTQIYMAFYTDNSAFAAGAIIFTLTGDGIAGIPDGTLTSNSITPVGNGWYRCQITATATATATGVFRIQSATGNTNGFTGDGTSGIYIWGAQLEAGAFPTSYIPTTSAAVTRSADMASITGGNFSSWYRQDEGTVFASSFAMKNAGGVVWGVGDTFSNVIYVTAATAYNAFIRSADSLQAFLSASVSSSTTSNTCVAYKVNDFAAVSGGDAVSTDTSGAVPVSPIRLKLGSSAWDGGGTNVPCGHIRRLAYWPQRLPDTTLLSLTQ